MGSSSQHGSLVTIKIRQWGAGQGEAASLLSPGNPSSPSLLCLLVVIVGGWKQLIRTSKARAGQFLIISVSSHCSLLTHPDK